MLEYDPVDGSADMTKKGWLTAILELGAWIGTLLSGFLAEVISRKYGILVACSVFMLGVVIQATAVSVGYPAILGGRFITYVGAQCGKTGVGCCADPRAILAAVWASGVWL